MRTRASLRTLSMTTAPSRSMILLITSRDSVAGTVSIWAMAFLLPVMSTAHTLAMIAPAVMSHDRVTLLMAEAALQLCARKGERHDRHHIRIRPRGRNHARITLARTGRAVAVPLARARRHGLDRDCGGARHDTVLAACLDRAGRDTGYRQPPARACRARA